MRTGGEYRYTALRDGEEIAHFYGSVHRVWENEKIMQTFGFDEMPEAVASRPCPPSTSATAAPGSRSRRWWSRWRPRPG